MLGKRRNRFGESLVEAWYVRRADLLEAAQLNVAGDYRGESPVIWAAKRADPRYLQLVRVYQGLCGGAHLVVESGRSKEQQPDHRAARALSATARF